MLLGALLGDGVDRIGLALDRQPRCLAVHRAIGAADGGQADLGLIEGLAAPVVDLSGGICATRDRDGQSGGNTTGPVHHRGHGSLGRALSATTAARTGAVGAGQALGGQSSELDERRAPRTGLRVSTHG